MAVPIAAIGKAAGAVAGAGDSGGGKKKGGFIQGIAAVGQKGTDVAKRTTQAGVSGVTALVQGIKAKKLKEKADAQMPELVDPGQAAFLSELNAKRRSLDTGADFAAGMQQVDATNSGTNDAVVRASGGDTAGTIQSLLQSERVSDDAKNQVLAQGQQQQMQYNSMYGNQLKDITDRKLELQLMRSQQSRAEWAKMQSNASKNFMGFLGGGPMMGKKGDPSQAAGLPSAGQADPQAFTNSLTALKNPGLKITPKAAPAPTTQQQVFGTVSDSPVIDKGVQQEVFGSSAGNGANADFLKSVRGGFKK